jgi:hypothetical protein
MNYSDLKIAVCISGQVRTAIPGYLSFKSFFEDMNIDVFIHTWDKTTIRAGRQQIVIDEGPDVIEKIKELYQPVKLVQEKSRTWDPLMSFGSMFYSIMQANQLRLDYQIEKNFQYDLVIKYRFDALFPEHVKFRKMHYDIRTLYYPLSNQGIVYTDFGHHGISDIIFWGDSRTMNIVSDTYRYYYKLTEEMRLARQSGTFAWDVDRGQLSPGQIIYKRAIDHNIHPQLTEPMQHTLWRADMKFLHPFKDYDFIHDRYTQYG